MSLLLQQYYLLSTNFHNFWPKYNHSKSATKGSC